MARCTGTRTPRVEDARLLTGTGTYVDDVVRPGMLHACFVRSPVAWARIAGIDVSEALQLEGVQAVFVAEDLNPGVREQWYTLNGRDDPDTSRPPLAEGEVRFFGDPVAMVVAQDRYTAEDAAELVVVDYDELPPVVDHAAALESPESVHATHPGNLVGELAGRPMEELAPVFEDVPHAVAVTVHQQSYGPVSLETCGIVAEWSAPAGEMTIWAATQSPQKVRSFCARLLGVDEHRVRDTGGGFGQKVLTQRDDMCVMLAATKLPAVLKWIEDRQEHLMAAGRARHEHGEARLALHDEGRILAATLDHVQGAGASPTPSPVQSGLAVGLLFPGPYRIPQGTFRSRFVFSNTSGRVAYRRPWQFESSASRRRPPRSPRYSSSRYSYAAADATTGDQASPPSSPRPNPSHPVLRKRGRSCPDE
ncbi:molybdopterin cofactor-binding domain-containing protein [Streptomyces sp. NPDC002763]|uniref:xanthine dehydrogenase family protein molybdopterin-binding subunit n=1 Tax=Streptomyces sp. NPDC002763 TaxID=3154427 RepID=UPI00333282A1